MPNAYLFAKVIEKPNDKNGKPYLKITDHLNKTWFLFNREFTFELNKCYDVTYDLNEKGFATITNITPLVNIFEQKALEKMANRNDIIQNLGYSITHAIELLKANAIKLDEVFDWTLKIYEFEQVEADKIMSKLNPPKEVK
jgi:hypothetical protein